MLSHALKIYTDLPPCELHETVILALSGNISHSERARELSTFRPTSKVNTLPSVVFYLTKLGHYVKLDQQTINDQIIKVVSVQIRSSAH